MPRFLFNELSLFVGAVALVLGFSQTSLLRTKPVLPEGLTPVTMTDVRALDAGKLPFRTANTVNLGRVYPDGSFGSIPGAAATFAECVARELKRIDYSPHMGDSYQDLLFAYCSGKNGDRVYITPGGSLYMPPTVNPVL